MRLKLGYCKRCAMDAIPYRLSLVCDEWGECIDCAFSDDFSSKDVTGIRDPNQTTLEDWL